MAGEPHGVGAIVEAGAGAAHRDRNIGAFERALRRPRQFGVDHMPRPPREAIALTRRSGSAILDRQPAVIAAERETLVHLHATLDPGHLAPVAVDIVAGDAGAMAVRA